MCATPFLITKLALSSLKSVLREVSFALSPEDADCPPEKIAAFLDDFRDVDALDRAVVQLNLCAAGERAFHRFTVFRPR